MLLYILLGLAVIVVGFIAVVATRPGDFRITRSAAITAPPAIVFAQVNDLRKWQEFSPWAKMDPAAKNTYEGPATGVGAVFKWDGNKKVGAGIMTIIESRANELVRFKLEFLQPYQATNQVDFIFKAEAAQTVVTWNMAGKSNFVMKAMGLFMNFDEMIGGQFEAGLATLKALTEAAAKKS